MNDFDDHEQSCSDDNEGNDRVNEGAPIDNGASVIEIRSRVKGIFPSNRGFYRFDKVGVLGNDIRAI